MPEGISQRMGRILIVKAMKIIRSRAEMEIMFAWLMLSRSFPKFLRLPVMRSFDNVSLIPKVVPSLSYCLIVSFI